MEDSLGKAASLKTNRDAFLLLNLQVLSLWNMFDELSFFAKRLLDIVVFIVS
jgi:hypothetical protein